MLAGGALLALCLAAVLALAEAVVKDPAGSGRGPARTASIDRDLREFDGVNVSRGHFVFQASDEDGGGFAAAELDPPFQGVARGAWEVSWSTGDTVCYGATVRFPPGFLSAAEGVDLLRWDDWVDDSEHPDQGGVTVRDGRLGVFVEQASRSGTYAVLARSRPVPSGRWVRVVVQQHLETRAGEASTLLFVDGALQDSSTAPNTPGHPVRALRVGLVAAYGVGDVGTLRLDVDDVFFAERGCGSQDR